MAAPESMQKSTIRLAEGLLPGKHGEFEFFTSADVRAPMTSVPPLSTDIIRVCRPHPYRTGSMLGRHVFAKNGSSGLGNGLYPVPARRLGVEPG
jgi:hypothetical protein